MWRRGATSAFLFCSLVVPAGCGERDARSQTIGATAAEAGEMAQPAAGRAGAPVDSALLRARAMTDRLQELCESDSVAVRHAAAVAAADQAAIDSALAAQASDSMPGGSARVMNGGSAGVTAASSKNATVAKKSAAARKKPSAWAGPVARRAISHVPRRGALFPGCRVVAYYGNPLSRRMGILGEIAPDSMLARLERQAASYARVDSSVHVIPALELIAIVAQANAGRDGMYRARMPDSLIERVAAWAESRDYLLILDIQNGHSPMANELRSLVPFLKRPNVHLALDPEFAMPGNKHPGTVIGTMDAREVNMAVDTLARLVSEYELPPKMLIVHRFTRPMLTNHERIRLDPRVQVVIDMDGFGAPFLKRDSYRRYVFDHPVQFTGFKLFYKNDKPILSPREVVKLVPTPLFIMYQ